MEDTELSEDQLFAFRPEEGTLSSSQGRVHMIGICGEGTDS